MCVLYEIHQTQLKKQATTINEFPRQSQGNNDEQEVQNQSK